MSNRATNLDAFLDEAAGVADYAFQTGKVRDASLARAIETVKKLPEEDRGFDNDKVIDLYNMLLAIRQQIPAPTLSAIKKGWRPNRDKRSETALNSLFVLLAIFVTLAVGHLTLIHSRSNLLATDLQKLDESDAGLQFGVLERRLIRADHILQTTDGGKPSQDGSNTIATNVPSVDQQESDEQKLARDSALRDAYELRTLDRRLDLAALLTNNLSEDAFNPFPRVAAVYNFFTGSFDVVADKVSYFHCKWFIPKSNTKDNGDPCVYTSLYNTQAKDEFTKNYTPLGNFNLSEICPKLSNIKGGNSTEIRETDRQFLDYLASVSYVFEDRFGYKNIDIVEQNCSMDLRYVGSYLPNIKAMQENVRNIIALYSFIVLPSLYGALGALLFFIRRALDPYSPNLSFFKTSYRIAAGGLAGLAIAYFWTGADMTGQAFRNAGFGLFVLSFIFGFSIEVFFSFLDRLVELSTTSVRSIGADNKAKPAANPGGTGG